ncbi:MAG: hypothetical protein AAF138_07580 [Planctomycetota bacterium]
MSDRDDIFRDRLPRAVEDSASVGAEDAGPSDAAEGGAPWNWRRLAIAGGAVALGALVVLSVVTAGLIMQARRAPTWWGSGPASTVTQLDAERTGEAIEHGITRVLYSSSRPTDPAWGGSDGTWRSVPWGVTLEAADANAWLATRLPKWMASGSDPMPWPDDASPPRIAFEEGVLRLGVEFATEHGERVFSATVRPYVGVDGGLWLPAETLHVGRVPIPASWLLNRAEAERHEFVPEEWADRPETRALFDIFAGVRPVLYDPVFRLDGGRRVRVLGVSSEGGRVLVTCRTERR